MSQEEGWAIDTLAIHAGQDPDPVSGAVMTPIVLSSTFAQESPGKHKGYEYSRSGNPTRKALEARNYKIQTWRFTSNAQALSIGADGIRRGAGDPRGEGAAVAQEHVEVKAKRRK